MNAVRSSITSFPYDYYKHVRKLVFPKGINAFVDELIQDVETSAFGYLQLELKRTLVYENSYSRGEYCPIYFPLSFYQLPKIKELRANIRKHINDRKKMLRLKEREKLEKEEKQKRKIKEGIAANKSNEYIAYLTPDGELVTSRRGKTIPGDWKEVTCRIIR
jgi:hypothetical protein